MTYKLLKHEIDSARMTTGAGVDLVMYIPGVEGAATIQVKAQWEPLPAGGTGEAHCSWVFDRDCPADWLAVVDLSRDAAWLFEMDQARDLAQQKPDSGNWRIYWYADTANVSGNPRRESNVAAFEIDTVVKGIKARKNVEPEHVATGDVS